MNGEIYSGRYTPEEIKALTNVNARPHGIMKPFKPFYQKMAGEYGPTWAERREVFISLKVN